MVQHDRFKHSDYVDVAHDLARVPWPWQPDSFDFVLFFDVIEHLTGRERLDALDECWRILRPSGQVYIHTSHWRHPNAFSDLTHQFTFDVSVFDMFDPEAGPRWAEYGSLYTDKPWRIVEKGEQGQELYFVMEPRK